MPCNLLLFWQLTTWGNVGGWQSKMFESAIEQRALWWTEQRALVTTATNKKTKKQVDMGLDGESERGYEKQKVRRKTDRAGVKPEIHLILSRVSLWSPWWLHM